MRASQLPLPPPFAPAFDSDGTGQTRRVFTIGHSNLAIEEFIDLLNLHGITILVDVRSVPYSRYASQFCKAPLESCLNAASITYRWMGDTLGGRPSDSACYYDGIVRKGNVDYRALAQHPAYQSGLQNLLTQLNSDQVAIMCSEEDPRRCHRYHLIERSLQERGVEVLHIRRDGTSESITEQDITS